MLSKHIKFSVSIIEILNQTQASDQFVYTFTGASCLSFERAMHIARAGAASFDLLGLLFVFMSLEAVRCNVNTSA